MSRDEDRPVSVKMDDTMSDLMNKYRFVLNCMTDEARESKVDFWLYANIMLNAIADHVANVLQNVDPENAERVVSAMTNIVRANLKYIQAKKSGKTELSADDFMGQELNAFVVDTTH